MIRQPSPRPSTSSVSCGVNINTPLSGNFGDILSVMISSTEKSYTLLSKYGFCVFFTAIVRSMLDFIHRISGATSPIKMSPVYAFSITAFMRCVSAVLRARSVNFFANQPVNTMLDPINTNTSIATVIDGKRPWDAGIGMRQERGFDEFWNVHSAKHTHYASLVNGNVACLF